MLGGYGEKGGTEASIGGREDKRVFQALGQEKCSPDS